MLYVASRTTNNIVACLVPSPFAAQSAAAAVAVSFTGICSWHAEKERRLSVMLITQGWLLYALKKRTYMHVRSHLKNDLLGDICIEKNKLDKIVTYYTGVTLTGS